jgi:hypothetical protein
MPEFSPRKRMGRRSAILDPTNMQDCLIKVGLLPTKIDKLGRAEPVPESDQDHHCVTVALPIVLGRLDKALDLHRLVRIWVEKRTVVSRPFHHECARSVALFRRSLRGFRGFLRELASET